MFVSDSGRLAAKIGDGVPGMSPGLSYVKLRPSPCDSSLKLPNCDARSELPPPVSSTDCACADAFPTVAAATATTSNAAQARRDRPARRSGRCTDGVPCRRRRVGGRRGDGWFSTGAAQPAEPLAEHPGEAVGLAPQGHDGGRDRREDEAGLVGVLALHEWQKRAQPT